MSLKSFLDNLDSKELQLVESESYSNEIYKKRKYPHQPTPFQDEEPISWLCRFAKANSHTFYSLINNEIQNKGEYYTKHNLDRSLYHLPFPEDFIENLTASISNFDPSLFLKSIPNIQASGKLIKDLFKLIPILPKNIEGSLSSVTSTRILFTCKYCPSCLKEDKNPYIRKRWRYPFQFFCLSHSEILHYSCPKCNFIIKYWRSKDIFRCYNCSYDLRESESLPVNENKLNDFHFQSFWEKMPDNNTQLDSYFRDFYWAVIMAKDKRYGRNKFPKLTLEIFINLFNEAIERINTNSPMFECFSCNTTIPSWKAFRAHKCEPFIVCEVCDMKFKTKSKLQRHINGVHIKDQKYFCIVCKKGFTSNDAISKHVILHDNSRKRVICEICKKLFSTKDVMINHKNRVHYPKSHVCKKCGRKFAFKSILQNHVEQNHLEKDFVCAICCKVLKSHDGLNQHIYRVHPNKLFTCTECNKEFKRKDTLLAHIENFHKKISYNCEACGQDFAKKHSLAFHIKVQHNQFRYKCDICEKEFTHSYRVKEHKKIDHEGIFYQCTESNCNKKYRFKSALENHINIVHKMITLKCEYCNKSLKRRDYLNKHIKRYHTPVDVSN